MPSPSFVEVAVEMLILPGWIVSFLSDATYLVGDVVGTGAPRGRMADPPGVGNDRAGTTSSKIMFYNSHLLRIIMIAIVNCPCLS